MSVKLRVGCVLTALAVTALPFVVRAQSYPRTLVAAAAVSGANGALTGTLTIHVNELMHDVDFKQVADALQYGGYLQFLPALRKLPEIGYVQIGDRKTALKYARVRPGASPLLVLGTDRPIFFVGGGSPAAKPKAGYEVGVIELDIDAQGNGKGTMAAAARVKRGPDGGPIVEDYAEAPIQLTVKPSK
jgi:hypothetical protein